MSASAEALPVEVLREPLSGLVQGAGRAVLTATTGSGKSTQVPRWLAEVAPQVVVVEPRRVACRSLARYVAELEGTEVGDRVGFVHRDQEQRSARTRILFVTPGVALRMVAGGDLGPEVAVVLDEFHERGMEGDLLLGLLAARRGPLVVMSATLDAEALGGYLDAEVLRAEGRLHPVRVEYTECSLLPSADRLAARVRAGVTRALAATSGDVLVFLPGWREIEAARAACRGLPGVEVLALHGRLSGQDQDAVFRPGTRRRVIVSTNVAETSVTLPGISAVVDSGLVRRTLYRWGAASLGLVPIAEDSAEQRRGRAGRLGPGVCVRLWSPAGRLEARTPPEIHREPLDDLVLRAGVCGVRLDSLRLLDPPQPYALEHALGSLREMGAVDEAGDLTPRGHRMARLPLPPILAGLLDTCASEDVHRPARRGAVDLAAVLADGPQRVTDDALGDAPCDVTRALTLARGGGGEAWASRRRQARRRAASLRRQLGLTPAQPAPSPAAAASDGPPGPPSPAGAAPTGIEPQEVQALLRAALASNPRTAFVRRTRSDAFTNVGSEVTLGRDSALGEQAQALVLFALRAREGRRGTELLATCAAPISLVALADAGLGVERFERLEVTGGEVQAVTAVQYAGRTLTRREEAPTGPALCRAAARLIRRGSLRKGLAAQLARRRRAAWLANAVGLGLGPGDPAGTLVPVAAPAPAEDPEVEDPQPREDDEAWLAARLQEAGVETSEDLALLEDEDLLPAPLPSTISSQVDELFPAEVATPAGTYPVDYDPSSRRVTLLAPKALAQAKVPVGLLPRWEGWTIYLRAKNRDRRLRGRRPV